MESIATYSEVRFEGSRTFTLLPDKIIVRGKLTFKTEFETGISLTQLDPEPDKLWIRNQICIGGMWLAIICFVTCSVLISGFHMSFENLAPVMLAGAGMSGVLLMLCTYRKVEFFRFKNDGGIVILDIARAGKDASQLDSFINALTKQIKTARAVA